MTLNLPKKQVNAILVALDAEIGYSFESGSNLIGKIIQRWPLC